MKSTKAAKGSFSDERFPQDLTFDAGDRLVARKTFVGVLALSDLLPGMFEALFLKETVLLVGGRGFSPGFERLGVNSDAVKTKTFAQGQKTEKFDRLRMKAGVVFADAKHVVHPWDEELRTGFERIFDRTEIGRFGRAE